MVATTHDKSKDGTTWDGPWNSEVSKQELLDQFQGWEEEFRQVIQVRFQTAGDRVFEFSTGLSLCSTTVH